MGKVGVKVTGKGREHVLPLPVDVGTALVAWLRHRPAALDRAVFVRTRAPRQIMTTSRISGIIARLSGVAGIEVIHAHRLRHTAACRAWVLSDADGRASARIHVVEAELVSRAMAAAAALAEELMLRVDDVVVMHNSNKLAPRLLPCDTFVRVALMGPELAALEVEIAQRLAATAGPVAALEPRVEPRIYERDGFTLTFWTYYESVAPDWTVPGLVDTRISCP